MSATLIDKKHRMTLPVSICAAVDLKPNDQVEWRVEDGEIRGRKIDWETFCDCACVYEQAILGSGGLLGFYMKAEGVICA